MKPGASVLDSVIVLEFLIRRLAIEGGEWSGGSLLGTSASSTHALAVRLDTEGWSDRTTSL